MKKLRQRILKALVTTNIAARVSRALVCLFLTISILLSGGAFSYVHVTSSGNQHINYKSGISNVTAATQASLLFIALQDEIDEDDVDNDDIGTAFGLAGVANTPSKTHLASFVSCAKQLPNPTPKYILYKQLRAFIG